ncbi:LysR family transcriptional regulator [Sphingobium mellinum]|uniref:LysR family transcriptional regulator n=1 Tax=Sphingobium mellinum TaxID=1387166 RepID=UPI0030EB2F77
MGTETLDWNDFRFFLAVARAGTLSNAAKALGVDNATVGRRISSLEASLGAQLFDRSPQGYRLTALGEALTSSAERVEVSVMGAKARVDDLQNSTTGSLRIGATDAFGTYFMAPRLAKLKLELPGMHIDLVALTGILSLSKREADIAIGIARPDQGRLFSRKLTMFRLGLYASYDYLASHPEISTVEDLTAHPVINWVSSLMYDPSLNYISEVNPRIVPQYGCSNLVTQMKATVGGAGVCALPHYLARSEPTLRPILADTVEIELPYYLTVHADLHELSHIRKAIDFIVSEVDQFRSGF